MTYQSVDFFEEILCCSLDIQIRGFAKMQFKMTLLAAYLCLLSVIT